MTTITVAAERPYDVHIAHGALRQLGDLVDGAQRVAVIHPPTLDGLAKRVGELLGEVAVVHIEVPDAEGAKRVEVLSSCWDLLAAAGFTRSDAVVGLGGGATTDLAGFVAATWLRGVRLVTVPTTVLGMVDAAVGGKTGINIDAGKNLVGAFYEPAGVLCDLDLLADLPPAELVSGIAEVVKGGFIVDPVILDLIEEDPGEAITPGSDRLAELITRKVQVKAQVVSADLREMTSTGRSVGREILNYGHTLGHAIERCENYRWRHGSAISVGMVFAAELSQAAGLLSTDVVDRHRLILHRLGLPTSYRPDLWPEIRESMSIDKKSRGSSLRFVILEGLAQARILDSPNEDLLSLAYERVSLS